MKRLSFSSLRVRLFFLVLTAVLPALGLVFYTALEQRHSATVEAQETALRLARLASGSQGQLIGGVRQLLVSLSQLPEVRSGDTEGCGAFLSKLLQQYPLYANLGAASADGMVFCSALSALGTVNLSDRGYFQRAIQTGDFAIGDYQIGRITGKATVNFGYPVIKDGRIQAVVFSALDLAWLNRLASEAALPPGSTFSVIDRNGTVLVQYPDPERWVGRSLKNASFLRTILDQRTGVAEAASMEGVPSLFGFAPLFGTQASGDVYVGVGIPREAAFSEVNRIFSRHLLGLGLVGALTLLTAWVGSDLFILRQVNALAETTRRFAAGDFSARNGPSYRKGELGLLARTFDKMAELIQKHTAALEHQATHDRLTGLPNAALRQCRAWQEEGGAFSVSVNVSARNLLDSQFPDQVAGLLQTHGVSPSQLELEITESAIMADPSKALEILRRFNQRGISLSIDDFGTGYSSLGYLRKLPVETIKIDKSFVKNMIEDENDAMIVRSTIDLGHHLGLKVIAEGVENQKIWNHLATFCCDAAQGYYISRPIPAAELGQWLAEVAPQKGWFAGTTRDRNSR